MEHLPTYKDLQDFVTAMDGSCGRADFSAIVVAAPKHGGGYLTFAEMVPEETERFMSALYSAFVENPTLHSFVRLAVRAADARLGRESQEQH